jgi:endonuclease/exonuclease/phosphatase family metal-dependent hydrolase
VDVFCLQEAETQRLAPSVGSLSLVARTATGDMGLGIYADLERFHVLDSRIFTVRRALHDRFLLPGIERLLAARMEDRETGIVSTIASFHASPLSAVNATRRRQIDEAHRHLGEFSLGSPTLMVGDFNYPLFRSGLAKRVERAGYTLSVSDGPTYYYTPRIAYHFDFLTSTRMTVEGVRTLPVGLSDHRPILVDATPVGPDPHPPTAPTAVVDRAERDDADGVKPSE